VKLTFSFKKEGEESSLHLKGELVDKWKKTNLQNNIVV
jgi:hypothetical protein